MLYFFFSTVVRLPSSSRTIAAVVVAGFRPPAHRRFFKVRPPKLRRHHQFSVGEVPTRGGYTRRGLQLEAPLVHLEVAAIAMAQELLLRILFPPKNSLPK